MATRIITYVSAAFCVLLGLSELRAGLGMIVRQPGWGIGLTGFALVCFACAAVMLRLKRTPAVVDAPTDEPELVAA